MKIKLIQVGKTDEAWLQEGIGKYEKRLIHYCSFTCKTLLSSKYARNQNLVDLKKKEGETILQNLGQKDHVILLDDKGKSFTSEEFSERMSQYLLDPSVQDLVFVIGGPYGFDQKVYDRANSMLSLSKMTFSHQMVRLFFIEQVYRAFTIMKGEPYHHT